MADKNKLFLGTNQDTYIAADDAGNIVLQNERGGRAIVDNEGIKFGAEGAEPTAIGGGGGGVVEDDTLTFETSVFQFATTVGTYDNGFPEVSRGDIKIDLDGNVYYEDPNDSFYLENGNNWTGVPLPEFMEGYTPGNPFTQVAKDDVVAAGVTANFQSLITKAVKKKFPDSTGEAAWFEYDDQMSLPKFTCDIEFSINYPSFLAIEKHWQAILDSGVDVSQGPISYIASIINDTDSPYGIYAIPMREGGSLFHKKEKAIISTELYTTPDGPVNEFFFSTANTAPFTPLLNKNEDGNLMLMAPDLFMNWFNNNTVSNQPFDTRLLPLMSGYAYNSLGISSANTGLIDDALLKGLRIDTDGFLNLHMGSDNNPTNIRNITNITPNDTSAYSEAKANYSTSTFIYGIKIQISNVELLNFNNANFDRNTGIIDTTT
jgi:hypothetical protein